MKVNIYTGGEGKFIVCDISNVYPTDDEFFTKSNIEVSMEELNGEFIVYATLLDHKDEEGDPEELIEFANGRTCEETLKSLRKKCQDYFLTKVIRLSEEMGLYDDPNKED